MPSAQWPSSALHVCETLGPPFPRNAAPPVTLAATVACVVFEFTYQPMFAQRVAPLPLLHCL
jgi:hypothetical protein